MSDFSLSSISSFFFYLNWQSRIIIICKFYLQSGFDTTDFWCGIFRVRCKIFQHNKHRNFWKISESASTKPLSTLGGIFNQTNQFIHYLELHLHLVCMLPIRKYNGLTSHFSRNKSETLDRQSGPFQTLIIFESIANQQLMNKKKTPL